ncbi:MAG: uracil-DNA glycosylase [Pyrinomonadaceae bacterium]
MQQISETGDLIADIKEHLLYLQELGVHSLSVDLGATAAAPGGPAHPTISPSASPRPVPTADEPVVIPEVTIKTPTAAKIRAGSRIRSLPSLGERKSAAKDAPTAPLASDRAEADAKHSAQKAIGQETLAILPAGDETIEQIRIDIGNCTRCPLSQGRAQIVHTTGNMDAELMFIGEAPGADEDAQGVPFVGRAGKLLTQIIEAIGFSRDEVAIGNINRCRPPSNRQPTLPEAHTCRPFLMREIAVINPRVIVVLGNTAMHNLLDIKTGITKMRGQFHDYFDVKVMPTFHPAYLLRDPHKKREVWEDMKMVRDYLSQNPKN